MLIKRGCYHTHYNCDGHLYKDQACFSAIYRNIKGRHSIEVFTFITEKHSEHCQVFTDLEVSTWVSELEKVINGFKFSVYQTEGAIGYSEPCIHIVVSGDYNNITWRFILMWIRLTYEYPHCMGAIETMSLNKLPEFSHYGLINLHQLVMTTCFCYETGGGHYTNTKAEFLPYHKIEEILKNETVAQINAIFATRVQGISFYDITGDRRETNTYEDAHAFERRLETYKLNLQKLITHYEN